MSSDPRVWIATLRESHSRLAALVEPMTAEQVRAQSYDKDWSNAQVLSHLGSGAEIALLGLPAAVGEGKPVSRDEFPAIWDRWNAKSPDDQAADGLASDEQHVAALEQLSDEELAAARLEFFGMQLDAVGLVRLRLGEHALHTWDVAVMLDPAATVQADAVDLLADYVPQFLAPRLGKPAPEPFAVRITTTGPARDYLLTSGDSVTLVNWPGDGDVPDDVPQLTMPAEALLRLCAGRLDPDHTPADVTGDPEVLARLRTMFPGF